MTNFDLLDTDAPKVITATILNANNNQAPATDMLFVSDHPEIATVAPILFVANNICKVSPVSIGVATIIFSYTNSAGIILTDQFTVTVSPAPANHVVFTIA